MSIKGTGLLEKNIKQTIFANRPKKYILLITVSLYNA